MLVSMKDMLDAAYKEKRCVGAFMPWSYDTARAIANAAQSLNYPAIFIIGEADSRYLGGFAAVRKLVELAVENISVPLALHADHFDSYESIVEAIEGGYTSVMIDASRFPLEKNIEITRRVVEYAHKYGVSVEAELGRLPGNEGDQDVPDAEAFQTDPDEAVRFVKETGIDCLAVSIGTVHGDYKLPPNINVPLVKKISDKVNMPLVMHGGSGTPNEKIMQCVEYGISKINIATELLQTVGRKIAEVQQAPNYKFTVANLYKPAMDACEQLVRDKIKMLGKM